MTDKIVKDQTINQGIGSYIDYLNQLRLKDFKATLDLIFKESSKSLEHLDFNFENAENIMDATNSQIENLINSNRGGEKGVHGFIAEIAEVGIINAKEALNGFKPIAKLLNDNGKADITVNKEEFQMKFYNNYTKAIKKASDYESMKMMYPKDMFEVVEKIMNGENNIEVDGSQLSPNYINTIKKEVIKISEERGEPYRTWMKPSQLKYEEIQKGTIKNTMANKKNNQKKKYNVMKKDIKDESNSKVDLSRKKAQPSFSESHSVSSKIGLVQGSLSLGIFIYNKNKSGKKIWQFSKNDWIEAGVDFSKETSKGYITSTSVYYLTNVVGFNAPSAAAMTSATYALIDAVSLYRSNQIDSDDFINLIFTNTVDATGSAIGATLGFTLIPIPVLGPIIGSLIVNNAIKIGKNILNDNEISILRSYEASIEEFVSNLDKKYASIFEDLKNKYQKTEDFQYLVFDLNNNIKLRFLSSIDLAHSVGIKKTSVLKSINEIDNYFM